MSRAGATAERTTRRAREKTEFIVRDGLVVVAMHEWLTEEQNRVENAKHNLLSRLNDLGIPVSSEPYLIEGGLEELYPPHQRVCVNVDGLVFNYFAGSKGTHQDYPPCIQLVLARCASCGNGKPMMREVWSLADCAFPATDHGKHAIQRYKCGGDHCKNAAKVTAVDGNPV